LFSLHVKSAALALPLALILLACATQQTFEGSRVRAMAEVDKPHCRYIEDVASEVWVDLFAYRIPDAEFDDALNEALNAVASVGGNAYTINAGSNCVHLMLQAWQCGWQGMPSVSAAKRTSNLQEISATDRQQCEFIRTVAEASNWGFTKGRNSRNARTDALAKVQELGGNSYFLVKDFPYGGTACIILEAYRCSLTDP
jgi:hypothetical protein